MIRNLILNISLYTIIAMLSGTAIASDRALNKMPHPEPVDGIENVWRMDSNLLSGGDPVGENGLQLLRSKGVKSIISVDGSTPPVEVAKRLGLRYVHIPIGYDGIPGDSQSLLTQAFAQLPKPIYVHCHHGKHRGPAAASIMARFGLGWTPEQASKFMKMAGTSADYPGLYESVKQFEAVTFKDVASIKTPLPESVDVPALVDLMVQVDARFDNLKAWSVITLQAKGKSKKPSSKIDPVQEAVQLRELVRESARLPECRDQPASFRESMSHLESDLSSWIETIKAEGSSESLTDQTKTKLSAILKSSANRCVSCHRTFRDRPNQMKP
jgi:hypothetical protein